MRKTLLVIATLFITAQAYAGTVAIVVNDIGDGWASIGYSADANVSAFGLKVTTGTDANFIDINDYNVGECTAAVQGYGIFPGTIDINATTGLVDYNGTPVAPDTAPGAAGTGIGTGTLILEMGALYVDGNEPDLSGTLISVKVDGDCNVCVEGEPIRGNVVLTNADEATWSPTAPICTSISLAYDCGTCPLDVTGMVPGTPDGYIGPEDYGYLLDLINLCPYQYCLKTGCSDKDGCLDTTGMVPGTPDGYVGPEDLGYLLDLINLCPYQYCLCP